MPKMSVDELTALLSAEKASALSAMQSSKLSEERERAMAYYNGDVSQDMSSEVDRSKAVSFDVSDTVEGLMPALMEIFCGGDEVVKFSPVSAEDEEQADQETAYINHVFMQLNSGFIVTYSFIKDALISKNGVVKVSWVEEKREERSTYENLPDDVYALFIADGDVEIVEHTVHEDSQPVTSPVQADLGAAGGFGPSVPALPAAPPMMPGANPGQMIGPAVMPSPDGMGAARPDGGTPGPYVTHDVTIVRQKEYGCCRVEPVPPEEFGVSRRAKLGQKLDYCFHQVRRTQAALIDQGFDEAQIKDLPTAAADTTTEAVTRDTVDENQFGQTDSLNKSNREILITEHYAMVDYEGTGAATYRVTTGGTSDTKVLKRDGKDDIEPVDFDPFAVITPNIVTHRFFGRSIADLVIEIQRIKTSLLRGALDNIYSANNNRVEIAEDRSHTKTIDDWLDNRIGGVVRVRTSGAITPIPNQPIGDLVYPMLEYHDQVLERRTGVNRMGQGLDPEALQNLGDEARQRLQNAAMERTKLIARIFAETGFKDLFWKIHATVRKNEGTKPTVQLRGKWVTVDPREWQRRDHMTATVGLGGGSKSEQIAFWSNEVSTQQEALAAVPGLTSPGKIYNALKKRMELAGHKNVDDYWSNPDEQPPPEPQPNPEMIKVQGAMALEQQKAQSAHDVAAMQAQIKQREAEQKAQIEQLQAQADIATQDRKTQAEIALAERKFEFERELALMEHSLKMREMEMAATTKQQDQSFQRSMQTAAHNKTMMDETSKDAGTPSTIETMMEKIVSPLVESH